jgi:hypothetical protein
MPEGSPILLPPNEGTYFFIKLSLSDEVVNSVQPDTFDRFVVLATSRDRLNFPRDILPNLGERVVGHGSGGPGVPLVLVPDDGDDGRAGDGVARLGWFVQQLDVRVIGEE